jgi:hypothetical protein
MEDANITIPPNTHTLKMLSGSTLKIIAIVLMLIDHIGAVILYYGFLNNPVSMPLNYPQIFQLYSILRFIGRSSFPIFCFLLVQGFIYTSNRSRYALRLLLFALVSEIPFDLAIWNTVTTLEHQNVFLTLFIGFCVIWAIDTVSDNILLQLLIMALGGALAYVLHTDYSYWGILLISALYLFRHNIGLQTLAGCVSLFWEAPACLAFIPINMYNGKRGLSLKYFFYLFYPVHLLMLYIIRYLYFT